jgi:serine protease Do
MLMSFLRCAIPTLVVLTVSSAHASLPRIVAAAKPSVLAVGQWNLTSSPRFTFRGTGFVVGDGNQIITNAHVLPPPGDTTFGNELRVRIVTGAEAGTERGVTVVKVDRARDLAHLRMSGTPLPALTLAGPDFIAEGSGVAFIGFPIGGLLGMAHVTHRGIVSSVTSIVLPPPNAGALTPRAVSQLR